MPWAPLIAGSDRLGPQHHPGNSWERPQPSRRHAGGPWDGASAPGICPKSIPRPHIPPPCQHPCGGHLHCLQRAHVPGPGAAAGFPSPKGPSRPCPQPRGAYLLLPRGMGSVPAQGRGRCARRSEPGGLKVFRKLLIKGAAASAASSPSFSPTLPAAHTHTGHIAAARLCRAARSPSPAPHQSPLVRTRPCCPPIPGLLRGRHRSGPSVPICSPTWRDGRELHCTVGLSVSSWHTVTPPAGSPNCCHLTASPHPTPLPPAGTEMLLCSHINVLSSHMGAITPCLRVRERRGGVSLRLQLRYCRVCPWGTAHPSCDAR